MGSVGNYRNTGKERMTLISRKEGMISRVALALLLVSNFADGARLGEDVADVLPQFASFTCESDMCVLVTYFDGSTEILETNQENINGVNVNVFKGKAKSTGNKAV